MKKILLGLLLTSLAYASVGGVIVEGTVTKFDEKTVYIKQQTKVIAVPREFIKEHPHAGQKISTIPLDKDQLKLIK